jgi:ATP-dependent helicase/nuclease subunit A
MTNLDNLNLLYVAFTRAIERLYVICPQKGNKSFNASQLIKNALPAEIAEYGKREKKKTKTNFEKIKSIKFDSIIASDYLDKIIIQSKNSAIDRGNIIHKALANIITAENIEKAVNKLAAEGLIRVQEKDSYTDELNEIVNVKDAKDWFSGKWEVKTEPDILIPGGKTIRPDRVLIKDNKAIVIDYKTGSESEEHQTQVNEYADALIKSGFEKAEKYIYYVSSKKVKKV